MEEANDVLKTFLKDKSLELDGWTVEFFLHFLNFVGVDILEAIEESTIREHISTNLNTTYITLILKKD